LVFASDTLVAVRLTFDTVMERVAGFGKQANDPEARPLHLFLTAVRRKVDRLPDREFVGCHRASGIASDAALEGERRRKGLSATAP
jgi:hypothetical protein